MTDYPTEDQPFTDADFDVDYEPTQWADSWRTIQFFLDSRSGHIDEVEWREQEGEMRCTCGTEEKCLHRDLLGARVIQTPNGRHAIPVMLIEEAGDEIEARQLDLADPAVWRDVLLRYGIPVVV